MKLTRTGATLTGVILKVGLSHIFLLLLHQYSDITTTMGSPSQIKSYGDDGSQLLIAGSNSIDGRGVSSASKEHTSDRRRGLMMLQSSALVQERFVMNSQESADFRIPTRWKKSPQYVEWTPTREAVSRNVQATQTWTKLGADIDGEAAGDRSGRSVSLSNDGTVLAVGAPFNNGSRGHVRVYKYISNAWTQLGSDIDGEGIDNSGISVSLSSDGTVLAVGAYLNDGTAGILSKYCGHVRVFKFLNNVWTKLGNDIDGESAFDYSGESVSLSSDGTVVAVGALSSYGTTVRVYQYMNNSWTKLGNVIDGEAAGGFGRVSLSSDGTILAVGAYYSANGYVRVYKYFGNNWTQLGNRIDGEAAGDLFGHSVSLSDDGTVLAVGANSNDGGGISNRGHVRVYKYGTNGNAWTQLGNDIDGETLHDNSGWSVSLSSDGTVLAVGAYYNDGAYTSNLNDNRGHARVYQYINNVWTLVGNDIDGEAAGSLSGFSVSLSGNGSVIAIGAPDNDGTGHVDDNRGHVRVYFFQFPSPSPTSMPTASPSNKPITASPSHSPTADPSIAPTQPPTSASTTTAPSAAPSSAPTNKPTTASPSSAPTDMPSTASPSSNPTYKPTTAIPSNAPTIEPTTAGPSDSPTVAPTAAPTNSPITGFQRTLPFVGGCPAPVSDSVLHYEPGDRVSQGAIVFECKSWPNSLYCSQASFSPDLESKVDDWKQVWDVVGHCVGTIAPPAAGCPEVWTLGDMETYKENDQVSVIKSKSPLIQVIYKCRAWPNSWYCGQLSPLNFNGGKLGWDYVGECSGTISPTIFPTLSPATMIIAGCPDDYDLASVNSYVAGDTVSWAAAAVDSFSLYKNVYECREYPYSGYCSLSSYAPGKQYDYMAWTLLGPCHGTLVPTKAPISYSTDGSNGGSCTYTKVVTTTPTPTPVELPVVAWNNGSLYEAGDQVRLGLKKFQCKPWPFYHWCSVSAYRPTLSKTGYWTDAWTFVGMCPSNV